MTRYPAGYKPQYWAGDRWVYEERITIDGGMKASQLPAFLEAHGIPDTAEFTAVTEYDDEGPVVQLRWFTDVTEEGQS
jgi:hypothetical protein